MSEFLTGGHKSAWWLALTATWPMRESPQPRHHRQWAWVLPGLWGAWTDSAHDHGNRMALNLILSQCYWVTSPEIAVARCTQPCKGKCNAGKGNPSTNKRSKKDKSGRSREWDSEPSRVYQCNSRTELLRFKFPSAIHSPWVPGQAS